MKKTSFTFEAKEETSFYTRLRLALSFAHSRSFFCYNVSTRDLPSALQDKKKPIRELIPVLDPGGGQIDLLAWIDAPRDNNLYPTTRLSMHVISSPSCDKEMVSARRYFIALLVHIDVFSPRSGKWDSDVLAISTDLPFAWHLRENISRYRSVTGNVR